MISSPVVELPMVVDEIQDVVEGKPDEEVERVLVPKVVADEPVVDSNVDPVEPAVVVKVPENGLVENGSVVFLSSAVVLVGSDKIKERLLTFENKKDSNQIGNGTSEQSQARRYEHINLHITIFVAFYLMFAPVQWHHQTSRLMMTSAGLSYHH